MKSIPSFVLLFMGLITIGQQSVYYPNAMPWVGPIYPFYAQPHPYYPYYNGQFGFHPAIDQRYRNHNPYEETESRSRYRPSKIDFTTNSVAEESRLEASDNDDEHTDLDALTVYSREYEQQRSRGKTGGNVFGRFFGTGLNIGSGATANNILLKTSFVFVTSTGTLCSATSCIPASLFAAGSSNVICARKKRDAELLDQLNIAPSSVEKLVPTALPTLEQIKSPAAERDQSISSSVLHSSLIEDTQAFDGSDKSNLHLTESEYERKKRFLFYLTTTVTTYSFVTSMYTSTLSPAAPGDLTCRPAGIALC